MPQKKQTARKTTGKHLALTSALTCSPPKPAPRSKPKRVHWQQRSTATTGGGTSTCSKPSSIKPILTRPSATVSSLASLPPTTGLSRGLLDVLLSVGASPAKETVPASGTSTRRRPVLDAPISMYARFATWLESQKCVDDEVLLRAVERDGSRLLCLAKATVMFDNAVRGHVRPTMNDAASSLGEHARTLRVFAELLKSKISEGSLSEELETAVLRDGEALFRLATCCLEFDRAIRGSDTAQVK